MPAGCARRSRIRPLRFRPRANPVDDVASRFGKVLLAYPLPLLASLAHSALSPPDEESSQDRDLQHYSYGRRSIFGMGTPSRAFKLAGPTYTVRQKEG